jgi:tryptophan halogenase
MEHRLRMLHRQLRRLLMRYRSVAVIGGGTAGWLAALAVQRRFPDVAVTVIESRDIPIIGVGEATTTLMPPFLHGELGLDAAELFAAVRPTFKLGIRFEWGARDFCYPFGDTDPLRAVAADGQLDDQSLTAMLMHADRVAPSLLSRLKFAYHLDNQPFVAFLTRAAKARGVAHELMTIDNFVEQDGRIDAVQGDGRTLRYDFFVDCSGFRSLLARRSPFIDFSSSLFCDRALVATLPQPGPIRPYTTAETMNAGWCWRIPVRGEDHRGYVYSSRFLDDDTALTEMRAKNPDLREPKIVRFRSGRHRDFFGANFAAVGNAYGFVEPLESTALHMIIVELAYLLAALDDETMVPFANQSVGAHWDFLRWFLSIHYKFNTRLDTPFWRAARADTDSSGLDEAIQRLRRGESATGFQPGDPAFGHSGVQLLLLGQGVLTPPRSDDPAWRARVERDRLTVAAAPSQRDALDNLDPHAFCDDPRSWVRGQAERALVARHQPVHPRAG